MAIREAGTRHRPQSAPRPADDQRMLQYGRAWRRALELARRLVRDFGAARVLAHGDLLRPEAFTPEVPLTLVVWGLRADVFARVGTHPQGTRTVIVDADQLDERTRQRIQAEGVELARQGASPD